ncbi:MAG: YHS domain-containing (seleno)protein [Bacteroidota bacterium]
MQSLKWYIVIFLLAFVQGANSQSYVNQKDGVGIQGYDPVAYFIDQKAIKGDENFAETFQGVYYFFKNEEDKSLFHQNPEKYLPQYGGWCAFAMAKGEKVRIDPETFKVVDGKLYLFYNFYFNNTLASWNKDESGLMRKADLNWKKLTQ